MADKRVYIRSPIELAASFGIGEDSRPEREAKINNISSGGFCFTSEIKLRIGQEIDLAVDLDTMDEVVISVKVVWIKQAGSEKKYVVGVQIIEKEGPGFDRFIEFYNRQM
ncbi:MAG: PilZ domain-containing protein [Candidatus Margulisiibacteriota bacterium]